jgi:epsin
MVGDGGGFSSSEYSGRGDFQDRPSRSAQFEEYDEFDDGGARASVQRSSIPRKSTPRKEKPTPATPVKEVDLFSFDDDISATTTTTSNGKGKAVEMTTADDDFDDFQSATGTSTNATTAMPSLFSPPSVQSNHVQTNIPNISSTSSSPNSTTRSFTKSSNVFWESDTIFNHHPFSCKLSTKLFCSTIYHNRNIFSIDF